MIVSKENVVRGAKASTQVELEHDCLRMFYGLCLGDSLGFRTEFLSQAEIREKFGAQGILEPDSLALLSDDSQMTIALAKALSSADLKDSESILSEISKEFITWYRDPTMPSRNPGQACLAACERLAEGISPKLSGERDGLGAGAAMRSSVVGFVFRNDLPQLINISRLQARVTHANQEAEASAIAASLLIKFSFEGLSPIAMINEISDVISPVSIIASMQFRRIREVLSDSDNLRAMKNLGRGFLGREAVPLALYCMIKNPDSWIKTIQMAANYGDGDTDTIACIAGGAQALRLKNEIIPPDWIARLERREEIEELAKKVAAL